MAYLFIFDRFSYRNLVDLYFLLTSRNELKKELGSKQQPPFEFQAFMGFPILLRWLLDKVATLSFCNSIHLHQFALITFQPQRGDSELSEPGGQQYAPLYFIKSVITKIQQTKMLVMCQSLVICFYLGWSCSTLLITKHLIKVLTCSSNKL